MMPDGEVSGGQSPGGIVSTPSARGDITEQGGVRRTSHIAAFW
jgi:hypothetical protein